LVSDWAAVVAGPEAPFQRIARYYDAIYAARGRDPFGEIALLFPAWADDGLNVESRRILDAGCGTGIHLDALAQHGMVEGLDSSQDMLAFARARHPDLPLHLGDFAGFRLESRFNVICCLFGSIGYLPDRAALRRAISCLGDHLAAGGVLLLEPPVVADALEPPRPQRIETMLDDRPLIREGSAHVDGQSLEIAFTWRHLAGATEPECTVLERHRMLLLPSACWLSDMKDALPEGTRLSFESAGPRGRGLFKAIVSPVGGPGTG
jgi:SAM-dependent methyltransferase